MIIFALQRCEVGKYDFILVPLEREDKEILMTCARSHMKSVRQPEIDALSPSSSTVP